MEYVVHFTSMVLEAETPDEAIDKAGEFKGGGHWEAIPEGELSPEAQEVAEAASFVLARWGNGDLAEAVNALRIHHDLDVESSASRQHYIDTGRYLRNGEAI